MARPDSNSVGGRLILPFLLVASLAMTGSESSLADAAKKRDTAAIQALLINHSDVNARKSTGRQPCIGQRTGTICFTSVGNTWVTETRHSLRFPELA
jgi:hypothetical protein